ncbi:hypothetical protein PHYBLDRAFT_141980 [Phycomyces blakesleeanus NRRL 1555(-)]|uniref:Uncharacterized protein n=1 Tax=Phycomyces blakesleeanus (strain ATCC 8743b / DSM 1359 / FGSC 10004 / NBRC 33097 / NRRL 1555) TaxID=763407 RepID=A0A167PK81_PHYB8|nr:hypothetical protein PHYBLDRAFT_141980 [Phycomyces blakesleeanus NRRL 1555(-)]OAD78114.1 hypothetical protein PHYBLDRAFT_141980 [Phycomyces blakesleeanus NRRL 1555(-)]|eukprot:XP_018296154.1 hypothetical protein PHYBLDRAFT_141980 [Phycomyces blakesleeanus NRRL 1555(-)]
MRRWGRPYVTQQHLRYLTNNYIESWHNQLKTIYLNHIHIRRLDRLIFILTNDVEFYYKEEIQEDILPTMIISPSGEIRNSMEKSDGEWKIKSFTSSDLFASLDCVYFLQQDQYRLQLQLPEVSVAVDEKRNQLMASVSTLHH